jgi:hypothetical protein
LGSVSEAFIHAGSQEDSQQKEGQEIQWWSILADMLLKYFI